MDHYYLQTLNGVPVILNSDRTKYHIPSFIYDLIPYGATMRDEEFTEQIKTETFRWRPVPEGAWLADSPMAQTKE